MADARLDEFAVILLQDTPVAVAAPRSAPVAHFGLLYHSCRERCPRDSAGTVCCKGGLKARAAGLILCVPPSPTGHDGSRQATVRLLSGRKDAPSSCDQSESPYKAVIDLGGKVVDFGKAL